MNRHIATLLVICIMLNLTVFSVPTAAADSWTLPEGTPMYEPYVMDLDFGSLTLLEVGFAKKVQAGLPSVYDKDPKTIYYTAKDGFSIFAVKGILHNSTDSALELGPVQPKISYGPGDKWIGLYGYPIEPMGSPESHTLIPGEDVEIVFACEAPNAMYFGGMDLLMELGGSPLGFRRDDLKSFVSIGFTDEDGAPTGDITMLSGEEKKPEEIQPEGAETNLFTFSDPKIIPAEDSKKGMYRLDFILTCLYPEKSGEEYPAYFKLNYSLLDADQIAIKSTYLQVYNIYCGDKIRASACPSFRYNEGLITEDEFSQAYYVKFTGFSGKGIDGHTFKNPELFQLFEMPDCTAEDIEAALKGTWAVPGTDSGNFQFSDGIFRGEINNSFYGGTYEIDLKASVIDILVQASDGKVRIKIPFSYKKGKLVLRNDENKEFVKEGVPISSDTPDYTTEDIEAALSGTWIAPNSTVIGFRFSDGQFEKIYSSASLYGQYSINLEESSIELKITDADSVFGTVLDTMKLPSGSYAVEKLTFTFRDGILALTDSEGTELEKR